MGVFVDIWGNNQDIGKHYNAQADFGVFFDDGGVWDPAGWVKVRWATGAGGGAAPIVQNQDDGTGRQDAPCVRRHVGSGKRKNLWPRMNKDKTVLCLSVFICVHPWPCCFLRNC
jgi:hypothetical protein